jgi:tetratricopeptide (TPR) repeat protein
LRDNLFRRDFQFRKNASIFFLILVFFGSTNGFGHIRSIFHNNYGFVLLNHRMAGGHIQGDSNEIKIAFQRALNFADQNSQAYRGLTILQGAFLGDIPKETSHANVSYDAQTSLVIGNHFARFDNRHRALLWYTHSLEINSNQADLWLSKGKLQEDLGEAEAAVFSYRRSWLLDPEPALKPYLNLLIEVGDLMIAEQVLTVSLDNQDQINDGLRIWAWHTLGQLYAEQENYYSSSAVYAQALDEYPQEPLLLIGNGWLIYDSTGNVADALFYFEKAIELDSESGRGQFAIGYLYSREDKFDEAEIWFHEALLLNQNDIFWYLMRARTAARNKNFSLAQTVYLQAIEKFPDHAHVRYELALLYQNSNFSELALPALESAFELATKPDHRYYTLAGRIHESLGNLDEAIDFYQISDNINPEMDQFTNRIKTLNSQQDNQ